MSVSHMSTHIISEALRDRAQKKASAHPFLNGSIAMGRTCCFISCHRSGFRMAGVGFALVGKFSAKPWMPWGRRKAAELGRLRQSFQWPRSEESLMRLLLLC